VRYVTRISFFRPPMFHMSSSWCIAMMTDPAPRNKSALKMAWVVRWKNAAT